MMQELSLLEEKLVNGGALMMRHTEHSGSGGGGGSSDNHDGWERVPATGSGRMASVMDEYIERDIEEEKKRDKYEGKKIRASTGELVTVRTGSGPHLTGV